jgi:(2Fe-2S) ferredoxin
LARFERHVFVCTNQRDATAPRGSCTLDGKGVLHSLFKEKTAEAGLKGRVRANKAGCLDQCEHGPVVVVYPEQVWYGFVQPGDVDEIVREHLVGGRPVERLMLADSCINATVCPHKRAAGAAVQEGTVDPFSAVEPAPRSVL